MIKINGDNKSTKDVTVGIRKLFGSLPFLNKLTELINKNMKRIMNNTKATSTIRLITIKGFTILISVIKANL